MTIELTMLAYSVALSFLLIMIPAAVNLHMNGPVWGASNRERDPRGNAFRDRAIRARNNMFEAMALFTPLVLIAAVAGITNETTVFGAQLFFYSLLAHTGLYLAGVTWIRTAAWLGGVIGTAMIFLALL